MKKNRFLAFVLVLSCIFCLFAAEPAQAASLPSGIYLTQAESNTAAAASAAMMLRAKAYLEGCTNWAEITESSVKEVAWQNNIMKYSFTYAFGNISISVTEEISWALTLDAIKGILSSHPEGIVLQVTTSPYKYHELYIIDCVGDIVYCADPNSNYAGQRIPLASSYLQKLYRDQADMLSQVYAYWYVSAYTVKADPPEDPVVQPPAEPKTATVKGLNYKLNSKAKTAVLTGVKDKKVKSITVPDTIKVSGKTYKVTEIAANACKNLAKLTKVTIGKNVTKIGKNAFSGCKKLKTVTIKTTKLTKKGVGSGCFKGIDSKATFKVPKKMKKDYQNWLVKTGKAPKKAKFK